VPVLFRNVVIPTLSARRGGQAEREPFFPKAVIPGEARNLSSISALRSIALQSNLRSARNFPSIFLDFQ
jgi:hypothetical protein